MKTELKTADKGTSFFTNAKFKSLMSEKTATIANKLNVATVINGEALYNFLNGKIMGQQRVLRSVTRLIAGSSQTVTDKYKTNATANKGEVKKRPLANIFITGPSGTGKTYLGQCLSMFFYGKKYIPEQSYLIVNCNRCTDEKDKCYWLWGAEPLYSNAGVGELYKYMSTHSNNYNIIIFDEIEKAHEKFIQTLMDILDFATWKSPYDGRVFDFSKTIFLFTSNFAENEMEGVIKNNPIAIPDWQSYPYKLDTKTNVEHLEFKKAFDSVKNNINKTVKTILERRFDKASLGRFNLITTVDPLNIDAIVLLVQKMIQEEAAGKNIVFATEDNDNYEHMTDFICHYCSEYNANGAARDMRTKIADDLSSAIEELQNESDDDRFIPSDSYSFRYNNGVIQLFPYGESGDY